MIGISWVASLPPWLFLLIETAFALVFCTLHFVESTLIEGAGSLHGPAHHDGAAANHGRASIAGCIHVTTVATKLLKAKSVAKVRRNRKKASCMIHVPSKASAPVKVVGEEPDERPKGDVKRHSRRGDREMHQLVDLEFAAKDRNRAELNQWRAKEASRSSHSDAVSARLEQAEAHARERVSSRQSSIGHELSHAVTVVVTDAEQSSRPLPPSSPEASRAGIATEAQINADAQPR